MSRDGDAEALARAKERLDTLSLYPERVSLRGVKIWVVPWFFRIPGFQRFSGYTIHGRILMRREPRPDGADDLVTHELVHVWQLQHHPVRMPLSFLTTRYGKNGYEREARWAVEQTRAIA